MQATLASLQDSLDRIEQHLGTEPGCRRVGKPARPLPEHGVWYPVQVERAALVLMKFAMAPMATHLTPEQSWVGLPEPWRAMYRLKALEILEAGERKP